MPIFLKEANQLLKNRTYQIPKDLEKHLRNTLQQYGQYKNADGYKRLNSLLNPNYNKRSDYSKNGEKQISHSDLETIDHDLRHMSKNPNDLTRILNGGEEMANFARNTLNRERSQVEPVLKQKKVETRNKNAVKPNINPMKPIKLDKGNVQIHENILKENNQGHPYWDYISDYNPYYVFNAFLNKKNIWSPLINPSIYQKALNEFVKYGKFINFPTKYIYQWMGIIMKNTALLRSCTEIAGHSQWFPEDDFVDVFFEGDYDKWDDYKNEIGEDTYGAAWELLDNNGYGDWAMLPDGSDAISDFGIEPIEKLINEYNENLPPEQVIVIINKILDVVHCRGDLASMFIVGGRQTLSQISECISKKQNIKQIYITEKQLNIIKKNQNKY